MTTTHDDDLAALRALVEAANDRCVEWCPGCGLYGYAHTEDCPLPAAAAALDRLGERVARLERVAEAASRLLFEGYERVPTDDSVSEADAFGVELWVLNAALIALDAEPRDPEAGERGGG